VRQPILATPNSDCEATALICLALGIALGFGLVCLAIIWVDRWADNDAKLLWFIAPRWMAR
jgi:hypothetical protein